MMVPSERYHDPIGQALARMQRHGELDPIKKYVDFSQLKRAPRRKDAPLWVCPNGDIYLEAYSPFYMQAKEFLQQCAEPKCVPARQVRPPHLAVRVVVAVGGGVVLVWCWYCCCWWWSCVCFVYCSASSTTYVRGDTCVGTQSEMDKSSSSVRRWCC